VTRKSASASEAEELLEKARRFAPGTSAAMIHLAIDRLVAWQSGEVLDPAILMNKAVLAPAAVGDSRAFLAQLSAVGARVTLEAERDHHAWSAADAERLLHRSAGADFVVTTLKDAVKLGPVWPRKAPPLWYLSQRVIVESGAAELDRVLATFAPAAPTN